jgi:hypothetical protein
MQYKITSTGVTFSSNEIGVHFPNVSLPAVLSQGDMNYLGIEVVPDIPPTQAELELAAEIERQRVEQAIVDSVQARLDTFARTRNYDGILSACTYASSMVPKFKAEGLYCVGSRDNTWAALYNGLAEVQAGTRPMPSSYADIEPLLPELAWPA